MTTRKVRKEIYIERSEKELLKGLSQETGASESELICRAIDSYIGAVPPRPDVRAWEEARAFIDCLTQQGPVLGGRTWTRDDLHK